MLKIKKQKVEKTKKMPPIVRGEKFYYEGRVYVFLEEKKAKTLEGEKVTFTRCLNDNDRITHIPMKSKELLRFV